MTPQKGGGRSLARDSGPPQRRPRSNEVQRRIHSTCPCAVNATARTRKRTSFPARFAVAAASIVVLTALAVGAGILADSLPTFVVPLSVIAAAIACGIVLAVSP